MGAAGVLIAACAVAQLGIAPRIATLRGAMAGPPSTLAPSDPQRMAFGRLHMLSVAWLGIAMVASVAAMALPLIILRSRDRT